MWTTIGFCACVYTADGACKILACIRCLSILHICNAKDPLSPTTGARLQACIETAHANSGQLVLINGTPQVATVVQSPETIRRECQALQGLLVVGGSIALILGVAGIGTMLYLHRRYAFDWDIILFLLSRPARCTAT